MACVVKDSEGRSPFWYVCYTDPNGRRLKKSTGLRKKSEAMKMASQLQSASGMASKRTLTEERARKFISEIVASIHGGDGLRSFTVRQWFDHFCKIKAKAKSAKTALKYAQVARQFLDFLDLKAQLNILAVTSEDVRKWRERREATGLSASTLNDDITILSSFFNGARRDHVISDNPCTAIEPLPDTLSKKERKKQPFSVDQISALIETAEGDWKGVILVAAYIGARLGDCANLRWRNVDLLSKVKKITFKAGKTGDEIEVPIHTVLEDHLLSLPTPKNDEEYLFPTLAGHGSTNLSRQFSRLMEDAHIENRDIRKGGNGLGRQVRALSFHSLRHYFTSKLANLNVTEEQRMELTGHKTRDVHKDYTHWELEQLQKAVALLPSLK
jgi:integrase